MSVFVNKETKVLVQGITGTQASFHVKRSMDYGTNVLEFTPEIAGTFQYTCWMGMVRGVITVEE